MVNTKTFSQYIPWYHDLRGFRNSITPYCRSDHIVIIQRFKLYNIVAFPHFIWINRTGYWTVKSHQKCSVLLCIPNTTTTSHSTLLLYDVVNSCHLYYIYIFLHHHHVINHVISYINTVYYSVLLYSSVIPVMYSKYYSVVVYYITLSHHLLD